VGRPRTLITVDAIPFVAGSLCLDFVNTTGARAKGAPRERLLTYGDLLVWGERAGIIGSAAARRLRLLERRRENDVARALVRLRHVREELYQLFLGIAETRHVDATRLAGLGSLWRAARRRQQLVVGKQGIEIRLVANASDLDHMLWPIALSAIELLTSDRLQLIRRCAECDWLFLDESKNGSRRWCKSTCGNRARSRERYQRRQAAEEPRR
jgi:predicted RNA-binding Zn ribbon-like protein